VLVGVVCVIVGAPVAFLPWKLTCIETGRLDENIFIHCGLFSPPLLSCLGLPGSVLTGELQGMVEWTGMVCVSPSWQGYPTVVFSRSVSDSNRRDTPFLLTIQTFPFPPLFTLLHLPSPFHSLNSFSILGILGVTRFIYSSIHLSIYPSIHLSIYPSIHLSIYPSIYPSIVPQGYQGCGVARRHRYSSSRPSLPCFAPSLFHHVSFKNQGRQIKHAKGQRALSCYMYSTISPHQK